MFRKPLLLLWAVCSGLPERGNLRPGIYADVVLVAFEKVADRADFKDPHSMPMASRMYL